VEVDTITCLYGLVEKATKNLKCGVFTAGEWVNAVNASRVYCALPALSADALMAQATDLIKDRTTE